MRAVGVVDELGVQRLDSTQALRPEVGGVFDGRAVRLLLAAILDPRYVDQHESTQEWQPR
jgi:hypothetical protein